MSRSRLAEIAGFADELVLTYEIRKPPIAPLLFVQSEPIIVFGEDFGRAFDGRLEFDASSDKFLLFYNNRGQRPRASLRPRIRFSIAHELGHYFIDEHRHFLRRGGGAHNSCAGFLADSQIEREADTFAAHLLMPTHLFSDALRDPMLKDIVAQSELFETSLLATALRVVGATSRACAIVVSEEDHVSYCVKSEDMEARQVLFVKHGAALPADSASRKALEANNDDLKIYQQESDTHSWNVNRYGREHPLWEEAVYLAAYDRTITWLFYDPRDEPGEDEDDDE